MIKSYLKTACRNLLKHKGATIIKLLGLGIGMACCMLILVYLTDELSYNKFNAHYPDIYRVNFNKAGDGQQRSMANTPIPAGPAIAQDIPQVAAVARLYNRTGIMEAATAGQAKQKFEEQGVCFTDSTLFDIFSLHFTEGVAKGALAAPNSVVITTGMARKYFGSAPALGKSLLYDNKAILQVTGVVDQLPGASDLQFDFLVSFPTVYSVETRANGDFMRSNWLYNPAETYVLLHHGQQAAAVNTALRQLTKKYGDERVAKSYFFSLQPLADIHLHASDVEGNSSTNSITYIYIFAAIAFLILLIANINFINLSNAQSLTRISEIGIRKVSGAGARQLVAQFMGEGLLLSFAAFLLALLLTGLGLPLLNSITGKQLTVGALYNAASLAVFILLFLCTGLLAGLYPAVFITRFRLTSLLKGKTGYRGGGSAVRQLLIVTQFSVALALIIGAVVINRQLQFLRNKPLGFQKEHTLVLPLFGKGSSLLGSGVDGPLRARMNAFEDDLRKYSRIDAVTVASVLPGSLYVRGLVIPEGHKEQDNIFVPWASVDYDFIKTMELRLLAGRDFSKQTGTDHLQAFIINESAVQLFGWKNAQEAIGKNMTRGDSHTGKKGQVIGVIGDFNFSKLDRPLEPMIMDVNVPRFTSFAVRIAADHIPATIQYVQKKWETTFPERVFEYSFLDEDINALYKAQENLAMLVNCFALIAIFISCTGVFSLASFMAVQRTKEIGVRKVLGANIIQIVVLLFRDFQRLVFIAALVAVPLAWWLMHEWLNDFAYRCSLSWWIFAAAATGTLAITLLTVSFQAIKAARTNPVKSLRTE